MLFEPSYTTSISSLGNDSFNVEQYHQSLSLRRRILVDQMKWDLPTLGNLETDQYDTLFSQHVMVSDGDRVVGTMRLLPTDHDLFGTTYMILDAHRGKLPGMPSGIMQHEIVDPKVWEASRLAICSSVPEKDRNRVLSALVQEAISFIRDNGGNGMLGLMNPVFRRVFNRIGVEVSLFGPIKDQTDGPICVLKYDL